MPFSELPRHACFQNQLDTLTERFKNSKTTIVKHLDILKTDPFKGDRIPGHGNMHMRKLRVPLKEYKIGKRGGLRLVYMIFESNKQLLMVAIYSKRDYKTESSIQNMLRDNLKSILASL